MDAPAITVVVLDPIPTTWRARPWLKQTLPVSALLLPSQAAMAAATRTDPVASLRARLLAPPTLDTNARNVLADVVREVRAVCAVGRGDTLFLLTRGDQVPPKGLTAAVALAHRTAAAHRHAWSGGAFFHAAPRNPASNVGGDASPWLQWRVRPDASDDTLRFHHLTSRKFLCFRARDLAPALLHSDFKRTLPRVHHADAVDLALTHVLAASAVTCSAVDPATLVAAAGPALMPAARAALNRYMSTDPGPHAPPAPEVIRDVEGREWSEGWAARASAGVADDDAAACPPGDIACQDAAATEEWMRWERAAGAGVVAACVALGAACLWDAW